MSRPRQRPPGTERGRSRIHHDLSFGRQPYATPPTAKGAGDIWVEYDFGAEYVLSSARLFGDNGGSWNSQDWTLQAWDGDSYVDVFTSVDCFGSQWFEEAIDVIREGIEELPEEAELYYRLVVYLIKMGKYKEAFTYLENALTLDFDRHTILYELMPELQKQKAIYKIIAQFRDENPSSTP